MRKITVCSCGRKVVLNTDKHRFRPKWCPQCLQVVDNKSTKTRVLSVFQKHKQERRDETRRRFIDRMRRLKYSVEYIEKRLVKRFDSESY